MPKLSVPSGHPRLFVTAKELPAWKRACRGHRKPWVQRMLRNLDAMLAHPRARERLIRLGPRADLTALALGMAWQLTHQEKYARGAEFLLEQVEHAAHPARGYDSWGMAAEAYAYLYDWFHDRWRRTGRAREAARLALRAGWRALDEAQEHFIIEDFHNYTLGNHAGALAAAVAVGRDVAPEPRGDLLATMHALHFTGAPFEPLYFQDAYATPPTVRCLDAALRIHGGTGFHCAWESTGGYHRVDAYELAKFAQWWTAVLHGGHGGKLVWPELEFCAEAFLHGMWPDGRSVAFGDASPARGLPTYVFLMLNARTPRPEFEAALRHFAVSKIPHAPSTVSNELCTHHVLFAPRSLAPKSGEIPKTLPPGLETLPTAHRADPYIHWRSGWGPNDTHFALRCGTYGGRHNHLDAASFQIFRGAPLAMDNDLTAYHTQAHVEYCQRTIAHNTILVRNDAEKSWPGRYGYPVHNDGGQRLIFTSHQPPNRDTGGPHCAITEERRERLADEFDIGRIVACEPGEAADYLAADATRAYTYPWSGRGTNPSRRVEEFVRQVLFVKPDLFVIYDRVEATQPRFKKSWLLHALEAPVSFVHGRARKAPRGVHALPSGGPYEFTAGRGRLTVWPLLPRARRVRAIGGKGFENWIEHAVDAGGRGMNYPIEGSKHGHVRPAWRIEVSPAQPARRDSFLTVLHAGLTREAPARTKYRFEVTAAKGTIALKIFKASEREPLASAAFRERGPIEAEFEVARERAHIAHSAPRRVRRA